MQLAADWNIAGFVTEMRELTSEKAKDWRGYVAKVASLGNTFELQLTREQFELIGQGENIQCRGRFEEARGRLRLIATKIEKVGKGGAA